MAKRRRKMKKCRKTLPKLLEILNNIKIRVPVPPVGAVFKSKKDYNRRNNKKIVEKELNGR